MKLTHAMIQAGRTAAGGFNRHQLEALGVPWPPKQGWPARIAGTEISEEKYNEYVRLGKLPAKARRASANGQPEPEERVMLSIPKRFVGLVHEVLAAMERAEQKD